VRSAAEVPADQLQDASGSGPGHAAGLVTPESEAEAAAFLSDPAWGRVPVLPQAARSSVTGGAVPRGEIVLSVERLTAIGPVERRPGGGASVTCGAGVRLADLQAELASRGWYYPPVPTYQQALLGGTVSTNAGGAATFKYGATRRWVRGLRVLLWNGDRLELERGRVLAPPGRTFGLQHSDGSRVDVPVPAHRLPDLPKISAGYFAADPLDLVDLFIGAEGTLGLITAVTLDLVALPAGVLVGLAFVPDAQAALRLGAALARAAAAGRAAGDPRGPDVRAVEWLDRASLDLLRAGGDARARRVELPPADASAVLFELELHEASWTDDAILDELEATLQARAGRSASAPARLFALLAEHDAIEHLALALPGDAARRRALTELREAVPMRVGELLARRARDGADVRKVGGDLIVPPERLAEMVALYEEGFARRGLEHAIWGHLADGNLHPNALPRDAGETARGFAALLEFADAAIARGGCPLSEHGVGRNPLKQELLRRFVGSAAIARMREIKRVLDPHARFAPGVLFPAAGG